MNREEILRPAVGSRMAMLAFALVPVCPVITSDVVPARFGVTVNLVVNDSRSSTVVASTSTTPGFVFTMERGIVVPDST